MLDWIRVCHEIKCKENTRNLIQKLHGMRSHTLSTSEGAAPSRGFSVNLPGARSTHQHTDHMTEHNRNTTTPTVSSELNNETDEPETVDVHGGWLHSATYVSIDDTSEVRGLGDTNGDTTMEASVGYRVFVAFLWPR